MPGHSETRYRLVARTLKAADTYTKTEDARVITCVFVCSVNYVRTTTLVTLWLETARCPENVKIFLSRPQTCRRTPIHKDGRRNRPIPLKYQPRQYSRSVFLPRETGREVQSAVSNVTRDASNFGSVISQRKYVTKLGVTITTTCLQLTVRYRPLRWHENGTDQTSISLRGAVCTPAPALRGSGWPGTDSVLRPLRNLAGPVGPVQYLCTRWTNRLLLDTEALIGLWGTSPDLQDLRNIFALGGRMAYC
jgi:hypothetical protein